MIRVVPKTVKEATGCFSSAQHRHSSCPLPGKLNRLPTKGSPFGPGGSGAVLLGLRRRKKPDKNSTPAATAMAIRASILMVKGMRERGRLSRRSRT